MRENIARNQEMAKLRSIVGGRRGTGSPTGAAVSYAAIAKVNLDQNEARELLKRVTMDGGNGGGSGGGASPSGPDLSTTRKRSLLQDQKELVKRFSQEHVLLEPKTPQRDMSRQSVVARRRNSLSYPKEDMAVSPKETGRVVKLKNPEDVSDDESEDEEVTLKKNKLFKNMTKLKKHVKMVGKAALLLNMMKPQMITHKKGAKPPNYDICRSILSKQPMYRSRKECQQLLTLVKNVKFFQNLGTDAQLELCKVMGHMDVAWARQTIMKQGDPGSTFFVILLGSFQVQIKVQDSKNLKTVAELNQGDSFGEVRRRSAREDEQGRSNTRRGQATRNIRIGFTLACYRHTTCCVANALFAKKRCVLLIVFVANSLHQQHQAALISNNPRNATVVSAEPAELLLIEKEDYERVIKTLHVNELSKKIR